MGSSKNFLMQILSPYGDWPHPRGIQAVDKESTRRMKRALGGLSKILGARVPIYMGHPDDHSRGKKLKSLGYVHAIHEVDGGIAISSCYDDETYKKFIDGTYKSLSPRWQMEKLTDGRYRPVRLISVGITNNLNIEGSGELIRIKSAVEKSKQEMLGQKNSKLCSEILERAKNCNANAHSSCVKIKSAILEKKIETRTHKILPKKEKPNLAALAQERSERLNEPFTKSFAAIRRQYEKISAHG